MREKNSSTLDKGFEIEEKQLKEFKNFWNMYKIVREKKSFNFISLAANRFMRTYERKDRIDPAIDLWISSEFLFTYKKTNSKILRKRIAKFLEPEKASSNRRV